MKLKPFHLKFYVRMHIPVLKKMTSGEGVYMGKSNKLYNMQIEYRGNNIAECVLKACNYVGGNSRGDKITSFTILRGEGKGTNVKYGNYVESLWKR